MACCEARSKRTSGAALSGRLSGGDWRGSRGLGLADMLPGGDRQMGGCRSCHPARSHPTCRYKSVFPLALNHSAVPPLQIDRGREKCEKNLLCASRGTCGDSAISLIDCRFFRLQRISQRDILRRREMTTAVWLPVKKRPSASNKWSSQHVTDDVTVHVGEAEVAALIAVGEAPVVDS